MILRAGCLRLATRALPRAPEYLAKSKRKKGSDRKAASCRKPLGT